MRTLAIGHLSAAATTRCRTNGCCVGVQIVTPLPSGAAMNTCGSMAKCVTIGNRYSCSITKCGRGGRGIAPAERPFAQHVRVRERDHRDASRDPARAATADRAPARPRGRQAAVRASTPDESGRSLGGVLRRSPTTAATGSPKNFVSPVARIGRSANAGPIPRHWRREIVGGEHTRDARHLSAPCD